MKVLIVGCGYIGLALGAELVRRGNRVTGLRRTRSGEAELMKAGLTPATADVTSLETLLALSADYDWVVNCVSASGGGVEQYEQVYLEGTRNLLSWLSASPPRKFVYTSSTSVYGQIDGEWVDETSPTSPVSETGRLLVQVERELLKAANEGFPAAILRVAGIYGPGRAYWLEQLNSGTARLDGAGERILNMIHRDDVVGAVCAVLERGRAGQIYNAVDNQPVPQRVLLEGLSAHLKIPMPPVVPAGVLGARKRALTSKSVSNRKLRQELAFEMKFPSFREGYAHLLQTESSGT